MGRLRVHIRYMWGMFNLYINMKTFLYQGLILCGTILLMSIAFRDSFVLIGIPMWIVLSTFMLYVKWKETIKPDRDRFMKEFELEAKYPFLYQRFTEDKN